VKNERYKQARRQKERLSTGMPNTHLLARLQTGIVVWRLLEVLGGLGGLALEGQID
jgi:hypothetical protein